MHSLPGRILGVLALERQGYRLLVGGGNTKSIKLCLEGNQFLGIEYASPDAPKLDHGQNEGGALEGRVGICMRVEHVPNVFALCLVAVVLTGVFAGMVAGGSHSGCERGVSD